MAYFHLSAKIISRSNGNSAIGAAAYRSGQKLESEYNGITHDYSRKQHVQASVVLLPETAPADFADRQKLWNSVEQNEKQSNAQLARELVIYLPTELPEDVRQRIALEFLQETLVSDGMIVDVNFHNPPRSDSHKRPLDIDGNIATDPSQYIYDNNHLHALMPLRPIDKDGNWENKYEKVYICEKNGKQQAFTATELKNESGWEKIYHFRGENGKKSWHTKSYAITHPDECLELINRYPKCEQIENKTYERWNSEESLIKWREAWAIKVNQAFESLGMSERIDHRSYEAQGLDLIPTIHEGKAVTIAEKRLKEEYDEKIARGEEAVLKHTRVREINIAIREHNLQIKIKAELEKLQTKMEEFLQPIKARIENIGQSIAEKLERLRAEIIVTKVKIKDAVQLKGETDEKIQSNKLYIKELAPVHKEKIQHLQDELAELEDKYKRTPVIRVQKREELSEEIDQIKNEISLLNENRKIAGQTKKIITELEVTSERAGEQIEQLKAVRDEKQAEYSKIETCVPEPEVEKIKDERQAIRPRVEFEYKCHVQKIDFEKEAIKFDGVNLKDMSIAPLKLK